MGMPLFSGSDSEVVTQTSNLNPEHWIIIEHLQINQYLLVKIQYPECKNYEGFKILLYEDVTLLELRKQKKIDPHFCEDKTYKSPIARFEPTDRGWSVAYSLCTMLIDN